MHLWFIDLGVFDESCLLKIPDRILVCACSLSLWILKEDDDMHIAAPKHHHERGIMLWRGDHKGVLPFLLFHFLQWWYLCHSYTDSLFVWNQSITPNDHWLWFFLHWPILVLLFLWFLDHTAGELSYLFINELCNGTFDPLSCHSIWTKVGHDQYVRDDFTFEWCRPSRISPVTIIIQTNSYCTWSKMYTCPSIKYRDIVSRIESKCTLTDSFRL